MGLLLLGQEQAHFYDQGLAYQAISGTKYFTSR